RRRHTRFSRDWSSDVCSSDLSSTRRYGKDGLKITASQSTGTTRPSMISWPWGVCIQLLEARIQKVETSVPRATMAVAKKCSPGRSEERRVGEEWSYRRSQ